MVEQSDFQMKQQWLPLPITIGEKNATMKLEFLAITCNLLKARVQGATSFGFAEKLARDSKANR